MFKHYYEKLIKLSHRFYPVIILLFILLFLGELFFLKGNFRLNSDLKALFKGSNKTVQSLFNMEKRVGGYSTVDIVAESDSREKNIAFLKKLKKQIEPSPMIRFVELERDIDYLEDRAMLFLSLDKIKDIHKSVRERIADQVSTSLSLDDESDEKKNSNKNSGSSEMEKELDNLIAKLDTEKKKYNINRYFEADNGRFISMKVRPNTGETAVGDVKKIVTFIDSEIAKLHPEKQGINVEAGGSYRNRLKEVKAVENDVFSTLGICIALLALTIIFYFRSLKSLFIILLPLSIGVVSGVALTQVVVTEFTIISAFSFALLYGLGIDFGIHLLSRYGENREAGLKPEEAMIDTYRTTLPSIFAGALTTALAFLSLFFIEFKGFSDFGIVAGTGICTSLVAIVLFFPSIVFVFEKFFGLKINTIKLTFLEKVFNSLFAKRKLFFPLILVVILLSFASIFFIPFEYNLSKLNFPKTSDETALINRYRKAMNKEERDTISRTLPAYVMTNSLEETRDVTNTFKEMIRSDSYPIKAKDCLSIYSFIPENQKEKIRLIKRTKRLIERKKNLFPEKVINKIDDKVLPLLSITDEIEMDKLPEWIIDKLREKDGSYGKIVKLTVGGQKNNIQSVSMIKEHFGTIKGKLRDYEFIATYLLLADIKKVLDNDVFKAIILAFCVVFLTLLITFRSFCDSCIILMPLVSGLLAMVAVSYVSGISFNLFNMIVVPTVVGIGIDSSIHLFHRYKENREEDLSHILRHTGGAIFFSALTTFVGFASLAFAIHRGMKSIGMVASIGIITVTFMTIVAFPVAIAAWAGRRKRG